jgi:spermidine synthase
VSRIAPLAIALAACSILYELLAAQTLAVLGGNTVIWYSLTVGTFLMAMGIGSFVSRRFAKGAPWKTLLRVELALTAVGAAIVPLIRVAHFTHDYLSLHGAWAHGRILFYGSAGALVVLVGVLTGMELPLLMGIVKKTTGRKGAPNVILGLDYFGSLIGAVAFPLLLLPNLSLPALGFAVAVVNLLAAGFILVVHVGPVRPRAWTLPVLLGALLMVGIANVGGINRVLLKKYYYSFESSDGWTRLFSPLSDLPDIERARSPYQMIDVVRSLTPSFFQDLMVAYSRKYDAEPDYPVNHALYLNGDFQTSTRYDEIYHEWFAHVPVIGFGQTPRRVLILGGGDGLLLRELLKYDEIESVTLVDIDPLLPRLAREHPVLRRANGGAFESDRLTLRNTDGFQFVRHTRESWDAIYIDFPDARDYDLAKLYSREFYHFVRQRLRPGGFVAMDATGIVDFDRNPDGSRRVAPGSTWPIYYHTLRKAGFGMVRPFLSTMESDNEEALEIARSIDVRRVLRFRSGDPRGETPGHLQGDAARRAVEMCCESLEQGFILLAHEPRTLAPWRPPTVPLYILDETRYALTFAPEFDHPNEIDSAKVNSILRPLFPTTPWWRTRGR